MLIRIIWYHYNDCQYCVLSLNLCYLWNFPSALHTSLLPSWKSTQDREDEKRKNWTPNDVLHSVFHTTCSRFLRWSSFDRAHGRLASFEIGPRSMFPNSQIRLSVVFKLQITMITAPNCTSWLHWQRSSRSAVHLKRPDFSLFDTFLMYIQISVPQTTS